MRCPDLRRLIPDRCWAFELMPIPGVYSRTSVQFDESRFPHQEDFFRILESVESEFKQAPIDAITGRASRQVDCIPWCNKRVATVNTPEVASPVRNCITDEYTTLSVRHFSKIGDQKIDPGYSRWAASIPGRPVVIVQSARRGSCVFIICGVTLDSHSELLQIGNASNVPRGFFGHAQCRQEQSRKNGDDGDDNKEFNQCEWNFLIFSSCGWIGKLKKKNIQLNNDLFFWFVKSPKRRS